VKREHSDFIRRVMNGEIYTGLSGEAMARWALGWTDAPADHPHDRGDLGRCMNVYWAAPSDLRPMMRGWLTEQARRLRVAVDFQTPTFYEPHRYRRRT
jgi:hypothetical protein